jgi:hypothetical protein
MYNPYNLVFTFYVRENLKLIPITKNNRDNVIILFNSWINEIFCENFFLNDSTNNIVTKRIMGNLIFFEKKNELTERENMIIERVLNECEKEEFMDFDVKNVYKFTSAKKVYFFFKKHFNNYNINPFSFTYNDLTINEKMSFLHDIVL